MIPYVEIIGKYSLLPFSVIEPSQCWFELSYYGIGEFEIYAPATEKNLNALKGGNYAKIPNKPYLWVIKSVQYTFTASGARMISAKGYEAKWLLSTRIVIDPWETGTDLLNSVASLVNTTMGYSVPSARARRQIVGFYANGNSAVGVRIEKTQATRGLLSDFVLPFLKNYGVGSLVYFEENQTGAYYPLSVPNLMSWTLINGRDLSDEVIFAQSLDNLLSSDYLYDSSEYRNFCRVVSEHTENNVKTESIADVDKGKSGIDRVEMFLSSNISTKYTNASGEEINIPFAGTEYKALQAQEGEAQLAEHKLVKEFQGEIDLRMTPYKFGDDFFLGDFIGIRDETLGYQEKARILKYTFRQDSTGYGEEAEYGTE